MTSEKSILLVANWDSGVGYAWWLMESYWVQLARAYSTEERVIVAFPSISELSERLSVAPLNPVALDMCERGLSAIWRQCRFLKRNRVRLMYCSDWNTTSWRYLAYRLSGVRTIIVHDHTPGLRPAPTRGKRLLKQFVSRLPGLAVDGALGATEFVRQRLVNVTGFPAYKCFAVPNGLPAAMDWGPPLDLRAALNIPANRRILVMTGRASRYKRVDFAIRCVAAVISQGRHDLHFLFVGDGPDLGFFKNTAEQLGVSGYCTFAGRRDDVKQILPGCDFAIHPSSGEVGYSLSILEYMQSGLPVVVPNNPSVCGATVHTETGLVYREGDVDSAVECLRLLLDAPGLAHRLGDAARESMSRDYRLDVTHIALLAAFERIDPAWPRDFQQARHAG